MRRAGGALSAALRGVVTALLLVSSVAVARADGPLGSNGEPIDTSRYAIDLAAGPVVAGPRVTGLAGAYVAIAEDVDGNAYNPAAPAVRPAYSIDDFDYYLGAGVIFTASLLNSDFFNTGARSQAFTQRASDAAFVSLASNLQWGTFGLGLSVDARTFDMRPKGGSQSASLDGLQAGVASVRLQAARSMLDGQVVGGIGARFFGMSIDDADAKSLFDTAGVGYEAGVLIRPNGMPFRIGAAATTAAAARVSPDSTLQPDRNGDIVIGPRSDSPTYLPDSVRAPWRLELGAALQLGPRPLNPRWIPPRRFNVPRRLDMRRDRRKRERDYQTLIRRARLRGDMELARALQAQMAEDRERDARELRAFEAATRETMLTTYRALPRRYLLISASLLVRGPAEEAVGVESFLSGVVNRSGAKTTYSPHLGLEGELVRDRLRLRAGGYYEPTRFATSRGRVHLTLGFSVRVLQWSVFGIWPRYQRWQLQPALDVSERYVGWGLSIGSWY